MTERRSNRSRSNINYSKYHEGDDDDDFADPTPPMKKLKKDKENCNKSVQHKEKISTNDKKSKSRKPPPEDRLLELQIKKAVAASLKETGGNDNFKSVDVDDDSCFLVNDKPTSTQKDPGKGSKVENGYEIEVISSTTVSESPPRKRQKTTGRYNCIDSDSESTYSADSDASDDDDVPDNDENDDDFSIHEKLQVKNKNSKMKTITKVSKTPVSKSNVKTPKLTKSISKLKPSLPSTPTVINTLSVASSTGTTTTPKSTPLSRTPGSLQQKIPSWTPPGPAGKRSSESCNVKSPGGIRIGLSRQQRVKALHPSLTVQP